MTSVRGKLIAVEGVSGSAVAAEAWSALKASGGSPGVISWWDASGLFEQLAVAGREAGSPSPRTLLLLYAADLAFRLRCDIEPALAEGRIVIAAPYVDTAIAFGRAAGLGGRWLTNLFEFARRPSVRVAIATPPLSTDAAKGFIELASSRLAGRVLGLTEQQLMIRTRQHLAHSANRTARRGKKLAAASAGL